MIELTNIESLTAFKRNSAAYLKRIKKTRKPIALTVNGKAELVVIDAKSYQALMERLEQIERAETVAALEKGIEEFERGEGRPARQALEELRRKHGISR